MRASIQLRALRARVRHHPPMTLEIHNFPLFRRVRAVAKSSRARTAPRKPRGAPSAGGTCFAKAPRLCKKAVQKFRRKNTPWSTNRRAAVAKNALILTTPSRGRRVRAIALPGRARVAAESGPLRFPAVVVARRAAGYPSFLPTQYTLGTAT